MPGGDRTGPLGDGPMTGRQMGYCAGYPGPGTMDPGFGGGRGRGFGRGRGYGGGRGMAWRHGRGGRGRGSWGYPESYWGAWSGFYGPPQDPRVREYELNMLRDQASHMEGAIKDIRRRIAELEQETATTE